MKPIIQVHDFYAIYSEREENGQFIVTGVLGARPQSTLEAKFWMEQGGDRENWRTTNYACVRPAK